MIKPEIKSEKKILELSDTAKNLAQKLELLAVFVEVPNYAIDLVQNAIDTLKSAVEVVSAVSTEVVKAGGIVEPDTSEQIINIYSGPLSSLKDLQERMKEGYVQFEYKKKNGEVRKALGTTSIGLVPVDKHPKNDPTFEKIFYGHMSTEQKYFDYDVMDWRAFVKINLLLPDSSPNFESDDTDDFFADI